MVRLWADRSVHMGVAFLLCVGGEVGFCGGELAVSGYVRRWRGEGQGGSVLVGVGTGFLCGEETKGGSPRGTS